MYYLVISAAFFAVLFLVLYFKERRAKEIGQRELRIVNSKLEDENRLHEKANRELSSIERRLTDSEASRSSLESRIRIVDGRVQDLIAENTNLHEELSRHKQNLENLLRSNKSSIPWLAGMMADFMTYDIEVEAKKLDWGSNIQREKKVASLRIIRAEAKQRIEDRSLCFGNRSLYM